MALSRRDFFIASALVGASALSADTSSAVSKASPIGYLSSPTPKPLLFDPKTLNGMSEKLILSHHANNYGGAVKRVALINSQIAALSQDAPPFARGSLAREALIATNSMILHELYFENLGYTEAMPKKLASAIESSFGSAEKWQKDFTNIAMSLSGGSGWASLVYSERLNALVNVRAESHLEGLVEAKPLLVCDMYEHSYQMDFGTNTKAYLESFFKNICYTIVEKRFLSTKSLKCQN